MSLQVAVPDGPGWGTHTGSPGEVHATPLSEHVPAVTEGAQKERSYK
jgi:hypothetical protein